MKQTLSKVSDRGLELIAARFRALGELNRLKLIMELEDGEKNVSDLVAKTGLGQANASRHLRTLTSAGILYRRKAGLSVYYGIADTAFSQYARLFVAACAPRLQRSHKPSVNYLANPSGLSRHICRTFVRSRQGLSVPMPLCIIVKLCRGRNLLLWY